MMASMLATNLPDRMDESGLKQLVEPYGRVERILFIHHRDRRFAFVDMSDIKETRKAASALHGREMEGRRLFLQPYFPSIG